MTRLERVDRTDVIRTNKFYSQAIFVGEPDGIKPGIKQQNFDQLIKIAEFCGVNLAGATVLDVGCGTGDDYERFSGKGVARYRGVDISAAALRQARIKYPQGEFEEEDIIAAAPTELFDLVVASGTMSLRQRAADNYDFLESIVAAMWQRTKRGMAFNFYPDDNEIQPKHLFFYDEARVRAISSAIAGGSSLVFLKPTNTFSEGDGGLTRRTTVYVIRDGMLPPPSTQASPGV